MKKLILILILIIISGCSNNELTGKATQELILEGPYLVTNVVDGDTADVIINNKTERLRFSGINTPETGECYYQEAKNKLNSLILNKEVYLEKDISNRGNYGRLLRYIYLDENTNINIILIEEGYAKVYDKYKDDTKRYDELKEHEQLAIKDNLGVWNCKDNFKKCLFISSKNSDKYHTISCSYAKRINPENQICYYNLEEAKSSGKDFSGC